MRKFVRYQILPSSVQRLQKRNFWFASFLSNFFNLRSVVFSVTETTKSFNFWLHEETLLRLLYLTNLMTKALGLALSNILFTSPASSVNIAFIKVTPLIFHVSILKLYYIFSLFSLMSFRKSCFLNTGFTCPSQLQYLQIFHIKDETSLFKSLVSFSTLLFSNLLSLPETIFTTSAS